MNKEYVLFHLREAQDAIETTLKEIEAEDDCDYGNFVVDMAHVYHHVKTAWNARDSSAAEAETCSEEDFNRWRQLPTDLDMSV